MTHRIRSLIVVLGIVAHGAVALAQTVAQPATSHTPGAPPAAAALAPAPGPAASAGGSPTSVPGVPIHTIALGAAALLGTAALFGAAAWIGVLRRRLQRQAHVLRTAAERQLVPVQILSQVADAIVVTDAEGRVTRWNSGAESLFGIQLPAPIGQPLAALLTDRMATPRDGDLHAALASGLEWKGDAQIVRPSGDTLFIEATVRSFVGVEGGRSGTLLVARDVDARRRAELESGVRARQQAAVASLGQRALAGVDGQLLIDQATSLAAAILQLPAAATFELVDEGASLVMRAGEGWHHSPGAAERLVVDGMTYPSCILATESPTLAVDSCHAGRPAVDAFHLRQGVVAGAAAVIPGRTGAYGVLLVADRRDRCFSRDDLHFLHAVANVIGAAVDRSLIDADLRAELTLHTATLEAVGDGILVTDAAGRVRRYNQRLLEMWNYPPEIASEPIAEHWVQWSVGQCEDAAVRLADFRAAASSTEPQHAVITLTDGRVFERQSHPQLLDGTIDGRVWSYRDVTDRVRAEEERLRLETQMQHVQKLESLGVLAGGIAHDFNNLLVGMLGHAGLALAELEPDAPLYARIMQIQTSAQRAAELTNQMLAYSGRGRFVLQSTDLSEIVGEMTHLLRTGVSKNAEIVLDLHQGLPAFDGDPAQIRQVIMNLITNASDAIGDASGTIVVQTGHLHATRADLAGAWIGADAPEGEFVFAEVQDTGCGMDTATMERIFDPFFTTKFTGRGLGLAAVLGIIRGHQGAIMITSQPGAGTTFRVLLPATQVPAAPVALAPPPSPAIAAGARVLVVDDEAGVRAVAREALKRAGFEVVTANDGLDAIELLEHDSMFQGVLLDVTMPRMSGVEVFRLIKARQPNLPIVLTSGYSAQDATTRFGNDGVAAFIQKPFMPAALVRTMLDAVGSRRTSEVA